MKSALIRNLTSTTRGASTSEKPIGGSVDQYDLPHSIGGFVNFEAYLDEEIEVGAYFNGREVCRGFANLPRRDLNNSCRGFSLTWQEFIPPGSVKSGALKIHPFRRGQMQPALVEWEILIAVDELAAAMIQLTNVKHVLGDKFNEIQEDLSRTLPSELICKSLFTSSAPPNQANSRRSAEAYGHTEGVSGLLFPVGLESYGGDAILGKDGFIFLLTGSNNIIEQYRIEPNSIEANALRQGWLELFRLRRDRFHSHGIHYVQTIIPEKTTVLPEFFPQVIPGATPLLTALEEAIAADGILQEHYVSGRKILMREPGRTRTFRKVDTHLSPYGAHKLSQELIHLTATVAEESFEPDFINPCILDADLGNRFFDINIKDIVYEALVTDKFGSNPMLIEQEAPTRSGFTGYRQVWSCNNAPINKTLIVFGNSFCSFADWGQYTLSWWMARWFTKFHFIWNPNVDFGYVSKVKPDIVICQTIERFLTEVPQQ
jgi:hypothetical protein